jgi:hypothetical protein
MKINEIILKEAPFSPQELTTYASSLYQLGRSREAVLTLQIATDPKYNNSIDAIQGEVASRMSKMTGGDKEASKQEFDSAKNNYVKAFGGAPKSSPKSSEEPRSRGAQVGNTNAQKYDKRRVSSYRQKAKDFYHDNKIDTTSLGSTVDTSLNLGRKINSKLGQYSPRSSK